LRSRLVSRSRQEMETDTSQASAHSSLEGENVRMNTQSEVQPEIVEPVASHSYNLRRRV